MKIFTFLFVFLNNLYYICKKKIEYENKNRNGSIE